MAKINVGRVLLGGIVAGIVTDALGYLVDGVLLAPRWSAEMDLLGRPELASDQLIWLNVLGLVGGIATIWLYAAIRPRFGAGVLTAIYTGFAVWLIGVLLPNLSIMWILGLFPSTSPSLLRPGPWVRWSLERLPAPRSMGNPQNKPA